MNRAMAIVMTLLLVAGPTNAAAAWQASYYECDCSSPCEECATAAPPEPAVFGCGEATVIDTESVAPQTKPAAEPIAPPPATKPAAESPAPLAPVPVEPVAKPAMPPVTPATDAQPAETPPTEQPTAEPPFAPTVEPASPTVEPSPSTEQPITSTEEPAAPAEQPTNPVEDIFGDAAAPSTSEEPAAAESAPTVVEPAPATETPTDHPPAEAAPTEQPAEPPPAETPEAKDLFDSFGAATSILGEPGGWAGAEPRTWRDAAGLHACEARLTAVTADKVVLRRVDGDTIDVPYRDLCVEDLRFVRRQIEVRRTQLARASETIAASQAP